MASQSCLSVLRPSAVCSNYDSDSNRFVELRTFLFKVILASHLSPFAYRHQRHSSKHLPKPFKCISRHTKEMYPTKGPQSTSSHSSSVFPFALNHFKHMQRNKNKKNQIKQREDNVDDQKHNNYHRFYCLCACCFFFLLSV